MYKQISADVKEIAEVYLFIKTIDVVTYHKKYLNYSDEKIKRIVSVRDGDMSKGSTYLIDLKNNLSYRFRDHKKFASRSEFRGFFHWHNGSKLSERESFKKFEGVKDRLIIRETVSGEVHESTPIALVSMVPSVVAQKCIKTKHLERPVKVWKYFL